MVSRHARGLTQPRDWRQSPFSILFPRVAARLARAERIADRAISMLGYDERADPMLTDVVAEVRAGRDIKAVQVYTQVTGSTLGEAHLTVKLLKSRQPSH